MADHAPARASTRERRAVAVATTVVGLVHLVLAWWMHGPIIEPDEGGYLGIARWVAHGTRLPISPAPYRPGYGLLLAPVSLVTDNPLTLYHGALVVNAVLLATMVLSGWALARRLVPGADATTALYVAVAVACYGGFLLLGDFSIASNLFVPLTLGALVAVVRAWETDRRWRWALAGFAGAALVAVHPVGVVVAIAVGVAALFGVHLARWRDTARRVLFTAAGALVLVPITLLVASTRDDTPISRFRGARGATTGGAQDRVGYTFGQISDALHLTNPRGLLVAFAGQVLFLTAASAGLALVGVAIGARAAPRAVRDASADAGTRLRALGALIVVGTLAASVLVINPARTVPASALLYGRYNEQVVAIAILAGLVALPSLADPMRRLGVVVAGIAGTVITCAVIVAFAWPAAAHLHLVAFNDLLGGFGLLHALSRAGHDGLRTVVVVLAGVAVVGVGVLLAVTRRGGLRAAAVVTAVLFAVPALLAGVVVVRQSESRSGERTLVPVMMHAAATADPPTDCIGYVPGIETTFELSTYQLFAPDLRFASVAPGEPVGLLSGERACTRLVLARLGDPVLTSRGYQPIASEQTPDDQPVTLYRAPS